MIFGIILQWSGICKICTCHMRLGLAYFGLLAALFCGVDARCATPEYDVFVPISKYLSQGNDEALSAWFDDTLEILVLDSGCDASRAQAKQIIKSFFEAYTPRNFSVVHTAGNARSRYAVGNLVAGGEQFRVTIFVSCKSDNYKIQQLKVERL